MISGRWGLPRFLQTDRGETVKATAYNADGSVVVPASATYTLRDHHGTAVIDAQAASLSGAELSYAVGSTWFDGYGLPAHPWRESWVLTGGAVEPSPATLERLVMPCRVVPHQVITVGDFYVHHPEWRRQIPRVYQELPEGIGAAVQTAWAEMIRRMLTNNVWLNRILNWYALADVHKYWGMALVARAFADDAPGDTRWERRAADYSKRALDELEHHLGMLTDSDEDGVADNPERLEKVEPELFLTNPPTVDPLWGYGGSWPGHGWGPW